MVRKEVAFPRRRDVADGVRVADAADVFGVADGGLMDDELDGVSGVEIVKVETILNCVVITAANGCEMSAANEKLGVVGVEEWFGTDVVDGDGDGGVDETDEGMVGGALGVVGLSFGEVERGGAFLG